MDKSKKILFNLNSFQTSGNIVPLLNKVKFWQGAGFEVTLFCSKALKDKIDDLDLIGKYIFLELVGTRETQTTISFIFESLWRNIRSLRFVGRMRGQYSVVYSISSVLDLIIMPYLLKIRDKEIRWLTVFDNTVPFTGTGNKVVRFSNWLFFTLSTLLIRKADKVFAISLDLEKYLQRKKFRGDQIVLTGNGVEVDLIKKAQKQDKYKIDALFVGRINEAKGIYEMLKVLSAVKEQYPNFQLAIMGNGDRVSIEKFKAAISDQKLNKNIQFLGYKKGQEKYDIIKSSKCFWFLSETEGFPVSLMEAVSSGLKCFVYDLPAYRYYQNNELMIFDQKDHRAVAQAVIDLFNNRDFNNENGLALLPNFSWERIARIEFESIGR